jgi:TPR repeat protein
MAVGKSSTAKLADIHCLRMMPPRGALLFICLLFALAAGPAWAEERGAAQITSGEKPRQPFSAGVEAFDRGEYEKAREIWLTHAHRGDPAAQRNLAHIYRMGLGVPQDFVQAAAWYRLAADSGLARAQANLASMYLRGQGLEEDPRQAAYWFTAAATNGHVLAQYNLALLYLRGEGVERNEAKAAGWLYRAAKAGHKPAIHALGNLVAVISGPAGPPDPPKSQQPPTTAPAVSKPPPAVAAKSVPASEKQAEPKTTEPHKSQKVETATKKEIPEAPVAAGRLDSGNEITWSEIFAFFAGKPGPGQEESGPENAAEGLRGEQSGKDPVAAARRDFAAGLVALHAANYSAAKQRWQPLAKNGHAEAQYQLGKLYLHNDFSEADRPTGFFWLSRAAAQQHTSARIRKKALDSIMSAEEHLAARHLLREAD